MVTSLSPLPGPAPIIGPIIAIQWGWLPALIWILLGTLFIGWVQDYTSAMIAVRNEGTSFGGLSYRLISPRARIILLSFIYFYLLLIAGAFGNVVVSTAVNLKSAPMAWLFLTIGGVLAGQMIYRWKKDIILTTVVTVLIALLGIYLGTVGPSDKILGETLANSRVLWAIAAFVFCYFAAVLPIWRFALPINYVASYIVFLGLFFGIIGILILHPDFTLPAYTDFTIKIGPIWPIMFVTIACGAISGWHSLVSSSGTARQLESEMDARPVGAGVMFLEMLLAVFALIIAGTLYASAADYGAAVVKGPGGVFAAGVAKFLGAIGMPEAMGRSYGSVMMIVLAITIMQLVIRFMRVATSELLGDVSPLFKNPHIGTFVASILGCSPGSNGMVAIPLGVVRRREPTYGFPCLDAGYSLAHVRREKFRMDLLPYDLYVRHHGGGAPLYFIFFAQQSFDRSSTGRGADWEHPDGIGWLFPGYRRPPSGFRRFQGFRSVSNA